jgi:hypothetical protein
MRSVMAVVNFWSAESPSTIPVTLMITTSKMASDKKVAENMLWGGRFTGM